MKYIYVLILIISLGILLYLNNSRIENFISENVTETIPAEVHIDNTVQKSKKSMFSKLFLPLPDSIPTSSKFPRFTKLLNEMIPIMKNLGPILEKQYKEAFELLSACENAFLNNKLSEAKDYLEQHMRKYRKFNKVPIDLLIYKEEIYDLLYSIEESVQDTNELVE